MQLRLWRSPVFVVSLGASFGSAKTSVSEIALLERVLSFPDAFFCDRFGVTKTDKLNSEGFRRAHAGNFD